MLRLFSIYVYERLLYYSLDFAWYIASWFLEAYSYLIRSIALSRQESIKGGEEGALKCPHEIRFLVNP